MLGKLIDFSPLDQPQFNLIAFPGIDDVFRCKDDSLEHLGQFAKMFLVDFIKDAVLFEDVDVIGLEECIFERKS